MIPNRPMTIYTAASRKTPVLQAAPMDTKTFFDRLEISQTLPVTRDAYTKLSKGKQDDLKDIGAYIAGDLQGGRRKAGCVLTRSAAVIDLDNLPPGSTDEVIRRVEAIEICCVIHSTAKHSPATPRLRLIAPFSEDILADQCAPVVRLLCKAIQPEMTWFDPSTDEAGRLMYWPSHCQDVTPVYVRSEGRGFLDAPALLAQLDNWQNVSTWPQFPRGQTPARLAAKQEDPTAKLGVVGAFCRVYDIPAAIEKFLPGVYAPVENDSSRYSFATGSTAGGAVIYEDGKFLFSHHATDPAGGKLLNAFDLVRLHRFGDQDDDAKPDTPANRLSSFVAMCELARNDGLVSDLLARERVAQIAEDFQPGVSEEATLEFGKCEGLPLSMDVMRKTLAALGIDARNNLITGRAEIIGLPGTYSSENAANTLPVFLLDKLRAVGVKGVSKTAVMDYLANICDENRYNPVVEMLTGTVWDGITRLPELLRILGVSSGGLSATLVRKWLIQCVALAHNTIERPEAAEGVLTLQGDQGIGKTLFFRKLAMESQWYSDVKALNIQDRDSLIQVTTGWIAELNELDGSLKRDPAPIKALITSPADRIRAPYAREAAFRPRRTSLCATVNPGEFLRDETGDRRFWVVPVEYIDLPTLTTLPVRWFQQLWAEVYVLWKENPQGFRLTTQERQELNVANRQFRELLPGEEEIREALNFDLPPDQWIWASASELQRQFYASFARFTVVQIGRVLTKLSREDDRITFKRPQNIKTYWLPISIAPFVVPINEEKEPV